MSEFKPMIKMMTDEPSVILKLKKGGHVNSKKEHKEEHGHKSMHHMAMGGMMPAMMRKRGPMIAPRAMPPAMPGAMPASMMKKGGKMHHKAEGGHMESGKEHKAEMHEMHKIEKELKHHEGMKAGKAHHGLKHGGKVHHKAKGGAMLGKELDSYEARDAIKGNEGKFLQTKMVTAKKDTSHGTGAIKEKNAGGYKHGGAVHHKSGHPEGSKEHHMFMAKHHLKMHKEGGSAHHKKMHEHHKAMCGGGSMKKYAIGGTVSEGRAKAFENTMMHDGDHRDTAHGTGGIKEKNAGGYKHGGKVHHKKEGGHMDWENRPANGTPPGKTMGKTGEVREANAGGFKHGGHAAKKHHYAQGGMVDSGKAEKMPKKAKSEPVSISRLSGTFKKGGHAKKHSMF